MPMMMDSVFYLMNGYLKGNVPDWHFRDFYQEQMVPLYKRIEFGEYCEAYRESYACEIELLREVSALCEENAAPLYDAVYDAVKRYTEKEVKRGKTFLI